jgi:CRISPR-associated protein Cmr3
MTWIRIAPADAWFLRDGRPYTKGDTIQANVPSQFPPTPLTLTGAVRAGLALSNGWSGRGSWGSLQSVVLGSGPENTAELFVRGPFLMKDDQLLMPVSRHTIVRKANDRRIFSLLELADSAECDLDASVLPQRSASDREHAGWKTVENGYLDCDAQDRIVVALPPNQIIPEDEVFRLEWRVGIARNRETHTTGEGALYSSAYVRLPQGVALAAEVSGVPDDWKWPAMVPFGGEGRLGSITRIDRPRTAKLPRSDVSEIAVVCATPLRLPLTDGSVRAPLPGNQFFESLGLSDIELISACIDRPLMIGGWDSLAPGPTPLRPCLAPGSVLFCRGSGLAQLQTSQAAGFGADAHLGFNQFWLATVPRS